MRETGRALWTYEHRLPGRVYVCCGEVNRGLAILGDTLFLTTLDAQLIALDARGRPRACGRRSSPIRR